MEGSEVSEMRHATDRRSAVTLKSDQRRRVNMMLGVAVVAILLLRLDSAFAQDTSFGQRLFQDKADCQFCHGINGDGRGDPRSPGRAANLHETHLNREQLIEVIACGRPGPKCPISTNTPMRTRSAMD